MKKKMKKTLSLWLCVLLFAAGLPLGAQAASFNDVPSNAWYSQAVNSLADQGIVSGTGGGNYSPKATLTRAAFVTMLAKATLSATDLSQYTFSSSFSDVKSSYWGNRYINWAVETGVANGYEDNTFRPERAVTRQEMAVMVKNLAESTGKQFPNINSAMTFRIRAKLPLGQQRLCACANKPA